MKRPGGPAPYGIRKTPQRALFRKAAKKSEKNTKTALQL
jgi:hypothetical protein